MPVEVKKIPGGFIVDGLRLMKGRCGCTSIAKCCHTWSKVKQKGSEIAFEAKATTPDSEFIFKWGYTASKDGTTVTVNVEDDRNKDTYSGYIPPPASEWEIRGWTISGKTGEREDEDVYRCAVCKWLYKEKGETTCFADIADDWKCPTCGAGKDQFEKIT